MKKNTRNCLIIFTLFCFQTCKIAFCSTNELELLPYRGSELDIAMIGNLEDGISFYLPRYVEIESLKTFPAFSQNFLTNILPFIKFETYQKDREEQCVFLKPYFFMPGGRSACRIFYQEDSHIYGLGMVGNRLIRNNETFFLWNTDAFGFEKDVPSNIQKGKGAGKRTYQSHPWALGVEPDGRSFGIFFATSWRAEVSISSNYIDFFSEGPPFAVAIIKGESPQIVLKKFAKLTGTMELPPLWALGFHQSRWSYNSQREILTLAKEFAARKIPCSAIWCDIDYMDDFRIFTFNTNNFPAPKRLIDELNQYGIKTVWIIDPAVKADEKYSVYNAGIREDIFVKKPDQQIFSGRCWAGESVWPDFISNKARDWWKRELKKFLAGMNGICGLWLDMNEPAVFDSPDGTMPCNLLHFDGTSLKSHSECHNLYALYMAQATFEAMKENEPEKRHFILTRAGFSGIQRYAASWTGDNLQSLEHLKLSIAMCLNAGLSLQPFVGADVGGFAYSEDTNALSCWMAMGAFYPFYRVHTIKGEKRREPWAMGTELEAICRKSINIRYRLLPYLYTQFYKHMEEGQPIMKPLFFLSPENPSAHEIEGAFLLGDDLLIIMPWENSKQVIEVASKKARWHKIDLENAKAEYPAFYPEIFIREGAILPILKKAPESALEVKVPFADLLLIVSPDKAKKACGALYEDDGESLAYRHGNYILRKFIFENGKLKTGKQAGNLPIPESSTSFMIISNN